MSRFKPVYVEVTLEVDEPWFQGLARERPVDVVGAWVQFALSRFFAGEEHMTVVRVDSSEVAR